MRVESERILSMFRGCLCEWCKQRDHSSPHHVVTRGAGGPDHPANLISLCLFCHRQHHDGHEPETDQLLGLVAQREGVLQADIQRLVQRIRRAPKECRICEECGGYGKRLCSCCNCEACDGCGILNEFGEPWRGER